MWWAHTPASNSYVAKQTSTKCELAVRYRAKLSTNQFDVVSLVALKKENSCWKIANAHQLPIITPVSTNPANEVAQRLTGRNYLSWSALSTFRTCPLKYKFRYIDGLPEESVCSALVFGTGIHSAVEQHFQAILSGEEQPDVERLMFAYRSAWLPHDPDAIAFGSTETRASLDALA